MKTLSKHEFRLIKVIVYYVLEMKWSEMHLNTQHSCHTLVPRASNCKASEAFKIRSSNGLMRCDKCIRWRLRLWLVAFVL